jgi:hypothetical protein
VSMQHKVGEPSRRPAVDGAGKRLPARRPVGEGTAQAWQPRPLLAALAAAGILGLVVLAVVAVVQGLLRPGSASWRIRSWRWWQDPAAGCRT